LRVAPYTCHLWCNACLKVFSLKKNLCLSNFNEIRKHFSNEDTWRYSRDYVFNYFSLCNN
jgi:hypothetical protein